MPGNAHEEMRIFRHKRVAKHRQRRPQRRRRREGESAGTMITDQVESKCSWVGKGQGGRWVGKNRWVGCGAVNNQSFLLCPPPSTKPAQACMWQRQQNRMQTCEQLGWGRIEWGWWQGGMHVKCKWEFGNNKKNSQWITYHQW